MAFLHDRFKQFVVPIFKGDKFWGNGFFYNSWLITAKHVFNGFNLSEFTFVFNDSSYGIVDYAYAEYENPNMIKTNNYKDLAVLYTNVEAVGGLDLIDSLEDLEKKTAYYIGYNLDSNSNQPFLTSFKGTIEVQNMRVDDRFVICYQNTLIMTAVERAVQGMSGGPVFLDEIVVGMLITKPDNVSYCRLVSAKHIAEVVACLEKNIRLRNNQNI